MEAIAKDIWVQLGFAGLAIIGLGLWGSWERRERREAQQRERDARDRREQEYIGLITSKIEADTHIAGTLRDLAREIRERSRP